MHCKIYEELFDFKNKLFCDMGREYNFQKGMLHFVTVTWAAAQTYFKPWKIHTCLVFFTMLKDTTYVGYMKHKS